MFSNLSVLIRVCALLVHITVTFSFLSKASVLIENYLVSYYLKCTPKYHCYPLL